MLTERKFMKLMLSEYQSRLLEALSEVDIIDDRGNIIISKDLKVRHAKSGFEYTVDSVENVDGEINIVLRAPEEPRIEELPSEDRLISDSKLTEQEYMDAENSLDSVEPQEQINIEDVPEDEGSDLFVIDKEEFEKEYEIK